MCSTKTNPRNASAALSAIRTTLTIDELFAPPGSRALIARCGDALYLIAERAVEHAAATNTALDFAGQDACRLIAAEVRESVSLCVSRKTIVYPKDGRVYMHELAGDPRPRRLPVPAIAGTITAAQLADNGRHLLCIVRDDADFGLGAYGALCVDLRDVVAHPLKGVESTIEPKAFWSPGFGALMVFDSYGERLWRVSPRGREAMSIELPSATGRSFTDIVAHPTQPWVAVVAGDGTRDEPYLMQGSLNGDNRWEGSTQLGSGIPSCFRWHPSERKLLLERGVRRQSVLETITPVGAQLAAVTMPRGWMGSHLTWSGNGKRVFAVGSTGIVMWTPTEVKDRKSTKGAR
jgi:hypothetical protein